MNLKELLELADLGRQSRTLNEPIKKINQKIFDEVKEHIEDNASVMRIEGYLKKYPRPVSPQLSVDEIIAYSICSAWEHGESFISIPKGTYIKKSLGLIGEKFFTKFEEITPEMYSAKYGVDENTPDQFPCEPTFSEPEDRGFLFFKITPVE